MGDFIKDKVIVSKESNKTIIRMNDRLCGQIWHLVKDWPDVISNDENLKILADLNFAKKEQIEEITDAFYQIFKTISESSNEITICVTADENK